MKQFFGIFTFQFLFILLASNAIAGTIEISGIIALPDQVLPNTSNHSFGIKIFKNWNGYWFSSNEDCENVSISANMSSVQYSCTVTDDSEVIAVNVNAWNSVGVYQQNWYHSDGTTFSARSAEHLPGNASSQDINITLINSVEISGELSLQENTSLGEETDIIMKWYYFNGSYWNYVSQRFTFNAGGTNLLYSLHVPQVIGKTIIGYSWDGDSPAGYVKDGFYSTSGSVYARNEGTEIDVATASSPYDISLLQGAVVSGTVGMPEEETNSTAITVYLDIHDHTGSQISYFTIVIPAGQNSESFSVTLPPNKQAYIYYYGVSDTDNPYRPAAYYATSGMTINQGDATIFSTSSPPDNLNLTFIPAVMVSGTISMPEGMIADDYMELYLGAYSIDETTGIPTYLGGKSGWGIAAQESSANWSIMLSTEPIDYYIVCNIDRDQSDPGPEFLGKTYYSATAALNTADQLKFATKLNTAADPGPINTSLIIGDLITGTIVKQSGDVYNLSDQLSVSGTWPDMAYFDNASAGYWVSDETYAITVPVGAESITYGIAIPPSVQSFNLSYFFNSGSGEDIYHKKGYYSETGTKYCQTEASTFQSGSDYQDKDFVILNSDQISGTISLPTNLQASQTIQVNIGHIYDSPDSTEELSIASYPETIEIPIDQSSADYLIRVQRQCDGGDYYLGYNLNNPMYTPSGYYNGTGTVSSLNQAEPLAATQSHSEIDMQLIIMEVVANDINNDGEVNLKDAILGMQVLIGRTPSEPVTSSADSDMDGKIGLGEVIDILGSN